MDSSAAGKENIRSTTAKSVRRGVGPRSGTKKSTPLPRAPTPSHAVSAAAPSSPSKSLRTAVVPAARRSSSRVKAHTPNPWGISNAPPPAVVATAASVRLDPGATAAPGSNKGKKTRQQQTPKQRHSKPTVLPSPSASSVPPSGASSTEGTSGGGGGGGGGGVRENRRGTAKRSGGGVTRQAKKQPRRGVVVVGKDKEANKKKAKANEKKGDKTTAGPRKPARLTSDPPLRLSRQGRSDFDFDLTDDEIDMDDNGSTESAPRKGSAQQQRSEGSSSSRRTSATPGAARPGRKRARGDDHAGEKSARAEQTRKSSGRGGRNPQEELGSTRAAAPLRGPGRKSTTITSKNVRRSSTPAANQATSPPRSSSSASGGDGDGPPPLSPRGSWHLGALFGEPDDDDDDDGKGIEGDNGNHGVCNWRLSDDDNEDEDEVVDLPKRKQRRSAGSSGAAGTAAAAAAAAGSGKKKGRASGQGECGRGGGVDGRGGSKTRPSTGGGSGRGDGGDEGGDEAAKSGWADRLPPPAFIEGGRDSSAGSGSPPAGDQAVLEALKAQFKKVDSHRLKISN